MANIEILDYLKIIPNNGYFSSSVGEGDKFI